jgi:hypothetical protein
MMSWNKKIAPDPIARFQALAATCTTPVSPALTSSALQPVIERATGSDGGQVEQIASHIAANSPLTAAQAQPLVEAAVKDKSDPKAKADAVSEAVAGATGPSADIELSDPVMLEPGWRAGTAIALLLALAGCIACITILGDGKEVQEAALIGLAVLGVLTLVGILVLVMGYKNVKIKGAGPSAGGSSS